MSYRIVQVIAEAEHQKVLEAARKREDIIDAWWHNSTDESRLTYSFLVSSENSQAVIDALHTALGYSAGARIILLPVEAIIQEKAKNGETEKPESMHAPGISREELYTDVIQGAKLNNNFILLVLFSAIVAAIGMVENNAAVVIGAMVIAPLLGPNLAMALATALGDIELMARAVRTNLIGIGIAIFFSFIVGLLWHFPPDAPELLSRTHVGFDSVVLALASGAAAVLSLTSGASSVLVGVMVAVALLPPATAFGLLLGAGYYKLAMGACFLLAVNIVCVNLAAKLVFLFKGIRPRTWYEKQRASKAMRHYIIIWIATLLILVGAIYFLG